MSAFDSSAAAALVAAAAGAAGPCPADPAGAAAWERVVAERAHSLARLVAPLSERLAVLADCQSVTGVIVSVSDVKGRAVITTRPTMGKRGADGEIIRKVEYFRTDWLAEPAGVALAALARALVGRHCRFGKRIETKANGTGESVSMVEWITDLGPDPAGASAQPAAAPAPTPRSPRTGGEPAPAPSRLAVAYPGLVSDKDRNIVLGMARQVTGDRRRLLEDWMRTNGVPPLVSRDLTAEAALRCRAYLANVDAVAGAA